MKRLFEACDQRDPVVIAVESGTVVLFSAHAQGKSAVNEDAAGVWDRGRGGLVLAVADGLGGEAGGAEAASLAIRSLDRGLAQTTPGAPLRPVILDAFEGANQQILAQGIGSGTTLVVAEVDGTGVRLYHAGDSGALVVGQRGRVRIETTPHSPVGYAVASGMLEAEEAHYHDERHLLSNCLGARDMRVEMASPIETGRYDTLVLASDGVLDNVKRVDLIETIRKGPLDRAAAHLFQKIEATMAGGDRELPAHPDDATAIFYRSGRR